MPNAQIQPTKKRVRKMNKLYSIYDSKAKLYFRPFTARTRGEALRLFQQAANDKQTQIGEYPEDFILFEIGEFNDSNGNLTAEPHTSLGKALDYVRPTQSIGTPAAVKGFTDAILSDMEGKN